MRAYRRRLPLATTPRLLVVGLIVFGIACHQQQPPAVPAPRPATPRPEPTPAPPTNPTAVTSGSALIGAMHDRYVGKWYRNLTFVQKTTIGLTNGDSVVQTWHEAGALPGRLRIDQDRASKSGTLFARDSVYQFNNGRLVRADTGVNELLVLGFDVYAMPPDRTELVLGRLGFDLAKVHESSWRGKPVYVVGAAQGDTVSKQFWIERDRLLFVRMLHTNRQGRSDLRFNKYVEAGDGWIAIEVEQLINGKRRLLEEYTDVRTNVELSPALFDPVQWATAPHWAR
jgi:hypothetical protein